MIKNDTKYFIYLCVGLLLLLLTACESDQELPLAQVTNEITSISTEARVSTSSTATILPPSSTPTSKPTRTPTRTMHPTGTPVIATRPEDILGLWLGIENRDGMYHQFNADGTCHISKVRDTLETSPNVICNYWFEDSNLYMEEVEVKGLPVCGYPGVYQVQLLSKDKIRFIKVDDKCTGRVRTTAQLHESRD